MSICLFPNMAYLSETSRAIEIYKALREHGEAPLVATHGGTYEWVLREEGIPYHLVSPVLTPSRCREYVLANIGRQRNFYTVPELREHVDKETAFFREHRVRVVHTGFTLSTKLSTRVLNIPLATTHGSFFPLVFEKRIAPFRKDFDRGPVRLVPEVWKRRFANWLFSHAGIYTKPFHAVARDLRVTQVQSLADLFLGDYAFVTDTPEIIGITREEMAGWENVPDGRYSGRIRLMHAGAIYARLFGEVPPDVTEFLRPDKPGVFVALTSSVGKYLSTVYETLREIDARVIFCTTTHPKNFKAEEHILLRDHIPSHKVMPMCDIAIIHGGQGSVQTAIASGTPVIGFPLQPEQNLNLQLLENHGTGFNLPLYALRKKQLTLHINQLLTDPTYRVNMARLRAWQSSYDGPGNVARGLRALRDHSAPENPQ